MPESNLNLRKRALALLLFWPLIIYQHLAFSQNNVYKPAEINPQAGVFGFIENKGQVHDQHNQYNKLVKYLLPAKGINVELKINSFSYDTYTIKHFPRKARPYETGIDKNKIRDSLIYEFHRVDITLPGANASPTILAEERSADYLVSYNATHPNGINAYHYNKITYQDIYPGIDLVFVASNNQAQHSFEYYFIVRTNGNVKNIKLAYSGAENKIENNAIKLSLRGGDIREKIPGSFLVKANEKISLQTLFKAPKIKVKYKALGKNTYGFIAAGYDRAGTLVIDPTPDIVWGTYYGGGGNDWSVALARDSKGDLVIGGGSYGSSGIATTGAFLTTAPGNFDAIVGKFNPDGTLLWMTYYGGDEDDQALSVTTDAANNILVAGMTRSADGIATPGSHQPVKSLANDGFIVKFDQAGSRVWGTYYGGEEDADVLQSIKTDAKGNVIVAGWTFSTTGISTAGSYQPAYAGGGVLNGSDGFIAKLDSNGVRLWATYYGGDLPDRFNAMDLDDSGNIYAAGATQSTYGIASAGAFQPSLSGGGGDVLIVKFDNNGNRVWGTYFGSTDNEYAECIAVDHKSNVIIGGTTLSKSGISTPGSHQPLFGGETWDGYIAKFNSGGNRLWSTYYGGNGAEQIHAICSDINNNIVFTGETYSTTNISTANSYQPVGGGLGGQWATFIVKLDDDGVRQWGTYYGYGGPFGQGAGHGIVSDVSGNVLVTGITSFTDGIATCNALQPLWGGNSDVFIAKFSETLTTATSVTITTDAPGAVCAGTPIVFTAMATNPGSKPVYQWKVNGVNAGEDTSVFITESSANNDSVTCMLTTHPSQCNAGSVIVLSNAVAVLVTAPVTPSITISASSTSICTGNAVTFNAISVNGGIAPTYQWTINGLNAGINSADFINATLKNADIVSCVLGNSDGCTTNSSAVSNQVKITVNTIPVPVIKLSVSANNICPADMVRFTALVTNGPPSPVFRWQVNGNNTGTNADVYNGKNLLNGDLVSCVLSGTMPGCSSLVSVSSDTIVMIVKDVPVVTFLSPDTTILFGDSLRLTASVTGNIKNFTWSPATGLSNSSIPDPVAAPLVSTIYTLRVTGADGCFVEKGITITVAKNIFIPNSFTPNNDGKNDVFRIPPGLSFSLTGFSIYDRWGNEVFTTANIQRGWDGTFNGLASPAGVYIYIIHGHSSKGEVSLKGTLTLLR